MSSYAKLRRKRQLFVDAFVETGMLTKAAAAAGYGNRRLDVAGARIMANPEVKAAILERQEAAISAAGARRVKFIQTLCYRAFEAGKAIRGEDKQRVPFDKLPDEFLASIESIEFEADGSVKRVKLATNSAMRMLGEVLGTFKQVHEIAGKDGGPIQTEVVPMSDLEIARRVAHVIHQGLRLARPPTVLDPPNSGEEPDVSISS